MPSTAAATAGFTEAPDVEYTDLLTSAGHNVTRFLTLEDNPNVSSLNSYDLVIVGRSVNSGHFEEDAETASWNSLTVPLINMATWEDTPCGRTAWDFTREAPFQIRPDL